MKTTNIAAHIASEAARIAYEAVDAANTLARASKPASSIAAAYAKAAEAAKVSARIAYAKAVEAAEVSRSVAGRSAIAAEQAAANAAETGIPEDVKEANTALKAAEIARAIAVVVADKAAHD